MWDTSMRVQGSESKWINPQEMGRAILGLSVGLQREAQAIKEDSRPGNAGNS